MNKPFVHQKLCVWSKIIKQILKKSDFIPFKILNNEILDMLAHIIYEQIDSKVATGSKKPGTGKTNKYSLKTNKGMLQIQVYNRGGSKPFELNMYSS